jgi:uncharacterized protein (TIGR02265 family)
MTDRGSALRREPPEMTLEGRRFVDPPWESPLDGERALADIPASATISGMFFSYLVGAAKAQNVVLPSARERYLAFNFYPVVDLARLILEAAPHLSPGKPLRHALRTLGRRAPDAFLSSTLGKVTLGSTQGVHDAIAAIAHAYEVNLKPSRVAVIDKGPAWAVVRIEKVYYFLDSHHVGTFEGIYRFASIEGIVKIASKTTSAADLLMTWNG